MMEPVEIRRDQGSANPPQPWQRRWIELLRETRPLPAVACLGGAFSLRLWGPATRVTFRMVQLILFFALVWLVIMRDEIRFPQAIALVPAAVGLLFVLNSFRIATLIVIGNAGARKSVTARRVRWFAAVPAHDEFPAAAAALWTFRGKYRELDWSFGWVGIAAGELLFSFSGSDSIRHLRWRRPNRRGFGGSSCASWPLLLPFQSLRNLPFAGFSCGA